MPLQILQDWDDVSRWDRCPLVGSPPVVELGIRFHELFLGTPVRFRKGVTHIRTVDHEPKVCGQCREETDVGLVWR